MVPYCVTDSARACGNIDAGKSAVPAGISRMSVSPRENEENAHISTNRFAHGNTALQTILPKGSYAGLKHPGTTVLAGRLTVTGGGPHDMKKTSPVVLMPRFFVSENSKAALTHRIDGYDCAAKTC